MSHQISPVTIDKIGFVKALESLVASINQTDKIYIELVCMGFEQTENYPTNYLNSIYRIIQELLQNIIKHAEATNAIIQLIEHEDIIVIMAEDNGLGLTPERLKNPKGSEMNSIFSKVSYLKGTIEIETPGNGTLINIELPNQNINK
ncbi:sensor histidine kinase [Pedobacter sp. SL55]|uniref:sensor histidine kinase n=1 Tax=Pedobacter sp. SL55 TaxID=2995161 RepID=UPI003B63265A